MELNDFEENATLHSFNITGLRGKDHNICCENTEKKERRERIPFLFCLQLTDVLNKLSHPTNACINLALPFATGIFLCLHIFLQI